MSLNKGIVTCIFTPVIRELVHVTFYHPVWCYITSAVDICKPTPTCRREIRIIRKCDIFKLAIGNESLSEICIRNGDLNMKSTSDKPVVI
jgi:hypothetical protein